MERVFFFFFLPLGVINGVKSLYKKENYSSENKRFVQMSFSAIFLLTKITASIFQIIHIRDKILDPYVNGGLERGRKFQTRI